MRSRSAAQTGRKPGAGAEGLVHRGEGRRQLAPVARKAETYVPFARRSEVNTGNASDLRMLDQMFRESPGERLGGVRGIAVRTPGRVDPHERVKGAGWRRAAQDLT